MNATRLNFHWYQDQCDNGKLLSFYWYGNEETMLHFSDLTTEQQNNMQNYISGFVDACTVTDSEFLISSVKQNFQLECEEILD